MLSTKVKRILRCMWMQQIEGKLINSRANLARQGEKPKM